MYDVIIIGGGPAGITAAVYALRRRLNALMISRDLGGKTNQRLQLPGLDRHLVINGQEIVGQFVQELDYAEFPRLMDSVTAIETADGGYAVITQGGQTEVAPAVIVATGARPRMLDVPGEREFILRGLAYSAVSYSPLFVDRTAVVVGDTDLALRATAELARHASRVTLVAPTHGALGTALGQRLLETPNVTILEGYYVQRVKGDTFARSLTLTDGRLTHEVAADGFFVELGLLPNNAFVIGLVDRDPHGRIRIDARNRTSAKGIFAAGDVTDIYAEQVLVALGEGAKAALSAHEYLLNQGLLMGKSQPAGEWR